MTPRLRPTRPTLIMLIALPLAGCGTLAPADVSGVRSVLGNSLIGARGATSEDQSKIDRTIVRGCAGGVWTKAECKAHGEAVQ